jgi:uncharacterized cupin superfamily protein
LTEPAHEAPVFNLFGQVWDEQRAQPGFTWSRAAVARRLGGELLGASLYRLAPGQRLWPYHWHYANEELLVVFEGHPVLRTPDGERGLQPGDAALFRRGPDGAHELINPAEDPARVLVVSTMLHPEVARYPDSGRIGVFAGAPPVPGETAPLELLVDEPPTGADLASR